MNDTEKQDLYTLRWNISDRWGSQDGKSACLSILGKLLGETPASPEASTPTPPPSGSSRQLWLSAGHGGSDPGIVAHGRKEAVEAIELRDLIKTQLEGFTVWTDPNSWKTSDTAPWLMSRTSANDITCDIHFNGGDGFAKGVEVLTPKSYTAFEKTLAQSLAKSIADILESPLRGNFGHKTEADSQHGKLAMMRPPGENVLIEVCFLDNAEEMSRYEQKKHSIARAIASVLKNALTA